MAEPEQLIAYVGGDGKPVLVDATHPLPSISQGAANAANSQVTAGTVAGTLAVARATRRSLTVKNTDASITVYIGKATVTSSNGLPLKAGESVTVTWVGLVQVIADSGSPVVAIWDEWD